MSDRSLAERIAVAAREFIKYHEGPNTYTPDEFATDILGMVREQDREPCPEGCTGPALLRCPHGYPVGEQDREPDAMCHATNWRAVLDQYGDLTVRRYDPDECRDGSPPWPVYFATPPTSTSEGAVASEAVELLRVLTDFAPLWEDREGAVRCGYCNQATATHDHGEHCPWKCAEEWIAAAAPPKPESED